MAHHTFELIVNWLRLHDIDMALLKHFIEVGAKRTSNSVVLDSVRRWDWAGPGVWLHVDELVLQSNAVVLSAAESEIIGLKTHITVEYLKANIPWLADPSEKSVEALLFELHKLKAFLASN